MTTTTAVLNLSSVQTPELSVEVLHGGWHARTAHSRQRIVNAFGASDRPELHKRAKRIALCRCNASLRQSALGRLYICPDRCRDRLCATCGADRSRKVAAKITDRITTWNTCRFITLTLKADGQSIKERCTRLLASFRRLRQTEVWKKCVNRGIATVELTPGKNEGGSHVHLHVLVDGEYFPQPQLKKAWLRATGDSTIVHIKPAPDRQNAARYIASYVSKSSDLTCWPASRIVELADAIKNVRMLLEVGQRPPKVILEHEIERDEELAAGHSRTLCTLAELIAESRRTPGATAAWNELRELAPHLSIDFCKFVDVPWSNTTPKRLTTTGLTYAELFSCLFRLSASLPFADPN